MKEPEISKGILPIINATTSTLMRVNSSLQSRYKTLASLLQNNQVPFYHHATIWTRPASIN